MTENNETNRHQDELPPLFDPVTHYKQLMEANTKAIKSYCEAMKTAPDIQNIASTALTHLELVLKHIAESEYLAFAFEVRDLLTRKESELLGYSSFENDEITEDEPNPTDIKLNSLRDQIEALKKEFEEIERDVRNPLI